MKILFVSPYTPNLIRVRPYNLIRALSARGHDVTVLTLTTGESEEKDARTLLDNCRQVHTRTLHRWRSLFNSLRALPTSVPLQAVYCWQPALWDKMQALVEDEQFDVIHVEHLRGARYGLQLAQLPSGERPPIVWDSVDCISSLFSQAAKESKSFFGRWITRLELGRTEQYEGWLLGQFDRVLVTSPADRQALLSLSPNGARAPDVLVLPNGVDLSYFQPGDEGQRDPHTLVLSGKMSYHANITMALHLVNDIMPLVWARQPETKLTIVGKDPPREILSLAENPAITVTGTVPDMRVYLQRAAIAVAPLTYGAGIQNKILEAMACGTPVITTSQATSALSAVPGRDLLVANGAWPFAEAIVRLLQQPQQRAALGAAGLSYVRRRHDWAAVAGRLESIYETVRHSSAPPARIRQAA
ncbi:MAG TPA: glycosyltransferase [Candidatus Sulfomarinibacteraceae bacterium]|nr:glycosyltransferase [Candidatus Sulfomarinibacteraceae bacterium]